MMHAVDMFMALLAYVIPAILSLMFVLWRLASRYECNKATIITPSILFFVAIVYTLIAFFSGSENYHFSIWAGSFVTLVIVAIWVIDSARLRKQKRPITPINKTSSTGKAVARLLARILFVIIAVPTVFALSILSWQTATDPFFNQIDHDKFNSLDTSMQGLYLKLRAVSSVTDEWKYEKICNAETSGDFTTGAYFCSVTISIDKMAGSVADVNSLQAKYYPIINNSNVLKQKTELDPESPNVFGKIFAVSSAEKHYTELRSGIECRYLIELNQISDRINERANNYLYGSEIEGGKGNLEINLKCTEKARSHWYPVDEWTAMVIDD